jgi:hypothetical protein
MTKPALITGEQPKDTAVSFVSGTVTAWELCVCGHPIQDHAMNYVPGRHLDRRGACKTCGVHANGNLPCPSYQKGF